MTLNEESLVCMKSGDTSRRVMTVHEYSCLFFSSRVMSVDDESSVCMMSHEWCMKSHNCVWRVMSGV